MVQITEQQKNTLQDFELTKGIGNITQQQQYRVTKPATKQKKKTQTFCSFTQRNKLENMQENLKKWLYES